MIGKRILLFLRILLLVSPPQCCVASVTEGVKVPQSDAQHHAHRIVVLYGVDETAGGLVNQLLCHVGAFLFAVPLKAEIVLPDDALSRDSYDSPFWQQQWHRRPLKTLLDVERIVQRWHRHGVIVHKVRNCTLTDRHLRLQPSLHRLMSSFVHFVSGSSVYVYKTSGKVCFDHETESGAMLIEHSMMHYDAHNYGLENGLKAFLVCWPERFEATHRFPPHLNPSQRIACDVMQALPADIAPGGPGIGHAPLQYHFKGQVSCQIAGCAGLAQSTSSLCLEHLLEEHGT